MKLLPFFTALLLFLSCGKNNDCSTCENGGTCVGGECDCPPAWTGEKCQIERMPSSMTIHGVKILRWPAADAAGAGWDFLDGPDLKLVIHDAGQTLYASPDFYEDAVSGQAILFAPNLSVFFPNRPLTFEVYDYDDGLSADDFMGGIVGKVYQEGNKFPDTFTLDCDDCKVAVELTVSYYFD